MKFERTAWIGCAAIIWLFAAQAARADWTVAQLSPKDSTFKRLFKVKIKEVKGAKECAVTVNLDKHKAERLREYSHGTLIAAPVGTEVNVFAADKSIEMKEKRTPQSVTYTFKVPAEQWANVRFQFWENEGLGGEMYWFSLGDVATKTPRP